MGKEKWAKPHTLYKKLTQNESDSNIKCKTIKLKRKIKREYLCYLELDQGFLVLATKA